MDISGPYQSPYQRRYKRELGIQLGHIWFSQKTSVNGYKNQRFCRLRSQKPQLSFPDKAYSKPPVVDHVSQGKGTKEVACFPSTKYGIINGLQNYQFPPSCYLSMNPIICTNHIIPRSDEDVRRGKIFLFYETWSHAVICPLYDALVPGFPVEHWSFSLQWVRRTLR